MNATVDSITPGVCTTCGAPVTPEHEHNDQAESEASEEEKSNDQTSVPVTQTLESEDGN